MKDKLVLQMVPVEGNQEMLSKVPHKLIKDMAVVYRFLIDQGVKGEASILLTNENRLHSTRQMMTQSGSVCRVFEIWGGDATGVIEN